MTTDAHLPEEEARRPILLGIAGDSGSGKTTLTRGLVRILGEPPITHLAADGYHRYDRRQRGEHRLTPLSPEANYLDVLEQDLAALRRGEAVLAPVYRHQDGTFAASRYVRPGRIAIVEGLLCLHTPRMREVYDVRVYLDPPEDLRRRWKVARDCSRRGYTTDEVLEELDRREGDAEAYVRPQRRHADMVISFMPGDRGDQEHLDAKLVLRSGISHPDLRPLADGGPNGLTVHPRDDEITLWVPGTIDPQHSAAIQELVWDRMHFASHLRTGRLGEFTVGTQLHRSESLAIVQLLVLYQLVHARAAVDVGALDIRRDRPLQASSSPVAGAGAPTAG